MNRDHSKFPTSNENPNENLEEKQVIQNKHSIFLLSKNAMVSENLQTQKELLDRRTGLSGTVSERGVLTKVGRYDSV